MAVAVQALSPSADCRSRQGHAHPLSAPAALQTRRCVPFLRHTRAKACAELCAASVIAPWPAAPSSHARPGHRCQRRARAGAPTAPRRRSRSRHRPRRSAVRRPSPPRIGWARRRPHIPRCDCRPLAASGGGCGCAWLRGGCYVVRVACYVVRVTGADAVPNTHHAPRTTHHRKLLGRVPMSRNLMTATMSALKTKPRLSALTL